MKKIFSCLILGAIVTGIASCSKNKDNPTPVTPPLDFNTVQKILDDSVPVRFGGKCYAVIFVNGQEVFSKGYGGYDGSTKQLIGSCTKWLSASVIMKLVEEGSIQLTDSIGKFLPVFTTYHKGQITIAQLFAHTSGLPGESLQGYEKNQALTLAQAVDSIAKNVNLINVPGTKFYYGGVSMHIGGRIAEVVSGMSWSNLFRDRIGTPCGLSATDYGETTNPIIAGGARSTPNDYGKFLNMILSGGLTTNGKRVLTEASVAAMIKSQVGTVSVEYSPYPPAFITGDGLYGLGNWRDAPVENSSPGVFGSHPWVNYDKRIAGFIFTYVPTNGFLSTLPTCFEIRNQCRKIVQ